MPHQKDLSWQIYIYKEFWERKYESDSDMFIDQKSTNPTENIYSEELTGNC